MGLKWKVNLQNTNQHQAPEHLATIHPACGCCQVLPPDPKAATFSGVPCRAGVVEVEGPVLDSVRGQMVAGGMCAYAWCKSGEL